MLTKEQSTAINIKDKNTRKNVIMALSALSKKVSLIKNKTPASGIAMFAGCVECIGTDKESCI